MENLDKLNRLKSAIKSGNPELIDHALDEIKDHGDDTFITPLIEFIHQNLSRDVKEKIFQLFTDLKHENSVDQFIHELQNEKDLDILERLLRIVQWRNKNSSIVYLELNSLQYCCLFADLLMNLVWQFQ